MKLNILRLALTGLLVTAFAANAGAQELNLPAPSPLASTMQRVGSTDITVTYSSPGAKDRKVFKDLVKPGELWRTGANSATTIEFSTDVSVSGTAVAAGKYSIFSIPGEGKAAWTVILNKVWEQGGTRKYDIKEDAARVTIKPMKSPARERLTFIFSNTTDKATRLDLDWAGKRISLPITIATDAVAKAGIEAQQKATVSKIVGAARYLAANGDAKTAMTYYDAALMMDGDNWMVTWLKADLLAKGGDYKAAYPLAERAHVLGSKADYFFWKKNVEKALKEWKTKL
ncbi:MAG: hypothetical protein ACI9MR_002346 [Myxococcota bacterium]